MVWHCPSKSTFITLLTHLIKLLSIKLVAVNSALYNSKHSLGEQERIAFNDIIVIIILNITIIIFGDTIESKLFPGFNSA